jgi:DHA1 family inner membrane transport protein
LSGKAAQALSGRAALFALSAGNFAIGTGAFVLAGIITPLAADLGISIALAGQLFTVFALAYAIGSPFLVALTGHLPRRTVLILALGLLLGGNLLAALAPNLHLLFASRVLAAFGSALFTPTAALIALTSGESASRMRGLAIVLSGFTLAQIAGVPIGAYVGGSFGWRWGFGLATALAAISLVPILFTVPRDIPFHRTTLASMAAVFRDRPLLLAISLTTFLAAGQFTVYAYISPLVTDATGVATAGLAALLSTWGIAAFCGNLLGGFAGDRFGSRRSLIVTLTVAATVMFALPLMRVSLAAAVVIVFLWGLLSFVPGPPQQARILGAGRELGGLAISLNASANYVGAAIGASLGGAVVATVGLAPLSWVSGALTVAALAVLLISDRLLRGRSASLR